MAIVKAGIVSALLAILGATSVSAALSQCNSATGIWDSLNNEIGFDPCEVANAMREECGVPSHVSEVGVPDPSINSCLCQPQTFVMDGTCTACQSDNTVGIATYVTWSAWSKSCQATATPHTYFINIPVWANKLADTLRDNPQTVFDISEALSLAQGTPIASSGVTSTSLSGPKPSDGLNAASTLSGVAPPFTGTVTTTVVSASSSATLTPAASSSKSKSNVGAIAGGVVGGIALLALILGFFLLWRRRQRKARVAPSSEFTKFHQQPMLRPATNPTSTTPSPETAQLHGTLGASYAPVRQGSSDSGLEDELPQFTPGTYTGPVYEKPGQYIADPNSPAVTDSSRGHGSGSKAV